MNTTELKRGLTIGDLTAQMLQVFDHPSYPIPYGVVGLVDESLGTVTLGQPLGGALGDPTVAGIAYGKFGELVVASLARRASRLAVTPFEDYPKSYHWMGGVLYDDLAAAISGYPQEVDRLGSALMVYAMLNDVSLHHVGYRHGSPDTMWETAIAYARKHRTDILNRPAVDHERLYLPINAFEHGVVYAEHQFVPGVEDAPEKVHLDVVTPQPAELLRFLAAAFGDEPDLWSDGEENDPVGEYLVTSASRGIQFSVMARDRHWPVEIRW